MSMQATVSGGGFDFSVPSVGGSWSWKIVANNIQGAGQTYQFVNVMTPYGELTTAAIPIPGDVVAEMARTLTQVQQQLAPLIVLVSPTPAVFGVTVTEGDPSLQVGSVVVLNGGSFGSFMTATASPDAPWLFASPSSISSIGFGQNAQFTLSLNPALLLATASPFVGHVNLQDNRVPSTVMPVTVNVTVLPRPVMSVTPGNSVLTFALSTGTPSGSQPITVKNVGPAGSVLGFTVAKVQNGSPWLAFTPASGSSLASGGQDIITVSIVPSMVTLLAGVYTETLRFTSPNAPNSPVDVLVTLTVS